MKPIRSYIFLDTESDFHETALSYFSNPNFRSYLTTKVISEYLAVSSRLKIDENKIIDDLSLIKKNSHILFPNSLSLNILEDLFLKYLPTGNQVYDFEIVSVMLANNIRTIFTYNRKDFAHIEEISILDLN